MDDAERFQRRVQQARALRTMQRVALAALLLCVALLVLAHTQGRVGVWAWVAAFAEAATVGALADWFAVVALFRHPLGLPIPHTAIIQNNQQRIAHNLAQFVRDKFLEPSMLLQRMASFNPAQRLGEYLLQPERVQVLAGQLRSWAGQALQHLDDPAVEQEVVQVVQRQLHAWDAAPTVAQLLQQLAQGQYPDQVLNAGLLKVGEWVNTPKVRDMVAHKMADVARREFPRVTWLTDKLDYTDELANRLSDRLAQAVIDELVQVLRDAEHPLRARYAQEVAAIVHRMQEDPELQERVQTLKLQLLDSPALRGYVGEGWQRLRTWLQQDLQREDSALAQHLTHYAHRLGVHLRDDAVWQNTANAQLMLAAEHLAELLRDVAPAHIQRTVQEWDSAYMVQEIERVVGRDLQFIRLNGTLIGGCVGVVLHAILRWFPAAG